MSEPSVWKYWLCYVSFLSWNWIGRFGLPSVGAVDANSVCLCWVFAEILDVAEDVATAVLAGEVSEVGSETHVCGCAFLEIPFINRDASE